MKKIMGIVAILMMTIGGLQAQENSKNAIGIRLGDNNGFGSEISYQRLLNDENRLEVNLGFRSNNEFNNTKLTGLYQWVWTLENNFNWYVGVGGGLGTWKDKATSTSDTFIFGSGNIGVEYHFDIPLMVSLDYRPEVGFTDVYDGINSDFALSIRYKF